MNILYILQNGNTNQYKIGITGRELCKRISELQTGCPGEIRVVKEWQHPMAKVIRKYERILHRELEPSRTRANGEWFYLTEKMVNILCKPENVQEQNALIEKILKKSVVWA